jgi:hypothetical protein
MKKKNYLYKTTFSSVVKCIVDEDRSKFLSTASINELKNILPKDAYDYGKADLLPISANLAVINLANKNGDVLSTEIALKSYKSFII